MPVPAMTALLGAHAAAGGFDPLTDISWHDAFWADDPNWTDPGDGADVTSWNNAGTNGTDATGASNYPTFRSSVAGLNNKAAIDFFGEIDSQNDRLRAASGSLSSPFTIAAVILSKNSLQSTSDYLCDAASGSQSGVITASGATAMRYYSGTSITTDALSPDVVAGAMILFYTTNGASSLFEINGSDVSNGNPGTTSMNGISFCTNTNTNVFGAFYIAFFARYNGALGTTEKSDLHTWAQSYYGVA